MYRTRTLAKLPQWFNRPLILKVRVPKTSARYAGSGFLNRKEAARLKGRAIGYERGVRRAIRKVAQRQRAEGKRRLALVSDNHQSDASNQRNRAEDGRQRNCFLLFSGGFDGSDIEHLLTSCIRDALISKRQDREDNQDNPVKTAGFMVCSPVMLSRLVR